SAEAQRLAGERELSRFRQAMDSAPWAVLITDSAGAVVQASAPAGELLGVSAPDLAGKPLAVYVAEEERRAFRRLLLQMAHAEEPRTLPLTLAPRGRMQVEAEATVWAV